MPKHEPVHKLPYNYEFNDLYSRSKIFVVCQSADPKIMGYISHRLTQKDLEYFIHAGNAYPKLVKMLYGIITYYENYSPEWMPVMDDGYALLKEIGEME